MMYLSTRAEDGKKYTSAEVIKNGIADDGGLFVPECIPEVPIDKIDRMCRMTYPERAAHILSMFLTDYTYGELFDAASKAYSTDSFGEYAAPVAALVGSDLYVVELWHGPTAAFKDMALQIMPHLLSSALKKTGEKRDALILVATSGDTGKAALEGFKNIDRTQIHVFYPCNGVSEIQKRQMSTAEGDNVAVTAVRGNFDDCQSEVKKIFADGKTAEALSDRGVFLSSANSINWGRLVPQIVYYFSAYCDMVSNRCIRLGDRIDVAVPTGNFGNILACYIAKMMGLPIRYLVCASNKNRVLTDFFETGVYDGHREFYTTASPSMDILISSNLERLLYFVAGASKTRRYMQDLASDGRFEVEPEIMDAIRRDFFAYSADEAQCADGIRYLFDGFAYLCDTHTAVAVHAAISHKQLLDKRQKKKDKTAVLIASTASPYKFAPAVLSALGQTADTELEAQAKLAEVTHTDMPACLQDVMSKRIRFDKTVDRADMLCETLQHTV